jgi:uncharacterized RmlC-like cupin family protein
MTDQPKVIKAQDLESGPPTPGMARKQAEMAENVVMMEVRTEPGVTSGWHHHGEHTTYGFVISGKAKVEFGAGGREVLEAGPGDVFMMPAHAVHREGNPGHEEQVLLGLRIGSGPTVINVDGPDNG